MSAADMGGRLLRLLLVFGLAVLVGFGVRHFGRHLEQRPGPAGLGQGLFQGAAMPLAFPALLLGYDVPIYATQNNGVPYKLGYTLGVTGCGALFFGVLFTRMARWRKQT
jgi:hypothetical protein